MQRPPSTPSSWIAASIAHLRHRFTCRLCLQLLYTSRNQVAKSQKVLPQVAAGSSNACGNTQLRPTSQWWHALLDIPKARKLVALSWRRRSWFVPLIGASASSMPLRPFTYLQARRPMAPITQLLSSASSNQSQRREVMASNGALMRKNAETDVRMHTRSRFASTDLRCLVS